MAQACRTPLNRLVLGTATHAGLLLSRYVQTPIKDGEQKDRDELFEYARQACNHCFSLYANAYKIWRNQVAEKGVCEQLQVNGRMVLGLGSESPLETGLRLHHTYGTPLIPGSALKGLAAHYCDQVWGKQEREFRKEVEVTDENGNKRKRPGNYFMILFGTTEDSGHIVFHDAWITPDSLQDSLVRDVMTVHHPEYYKEQGNSAPSDFDDPTPIPFLSVRGAFEIALHCDVNGADGEKWVRLAMALLRDALAQWGIGGKTNAGYGRLRVPSALMQTTKKLTQLHRQERPQPPGKPQGQRPDVTPRETPRQAEQANKAMQEAKRALQGSKPQQQSSSVRENQRVNAEVISNDGRKVVVRLLENQNEEVTLQQPSYPKRTGEKVKVRVVKVDAIGRVTQIRP